MYDSILKLKVLGGITLIGYANDLAMVETRKTREGLE